MRCATGHSSVYHSLQGERYERRGVTYLARSLRISNELSAGSSEIFVVLEPLVLHALL